MQVTRNKEVILVIPFDNNNKNPWYSPMIKEAGFGKDIYLTATSDSSAVEIGTHILEAFTKATYNPKKK